MSVKILFWIALLFANVSFASEQFGDRLVVSINNTPYTQRQIETYIVIKESLRKSADVRLLRPADWDDAVNVFTDDMIIFQESLRLGSFQPAAATVDQLVAVVQGRAAKDKEFSGDLARLGVDDKDVWSVLETVLRVDAFRKSKNRQATIGTSGTGQTEPEEASQSDPGTDVKWFADLKTRSVVRLYEDAKSYKRIEGIW